MGAPDSSLTALEKDKNLKAQMYAVAFDDYMNPRITSPVNIVMAYTRSQVQGVGRVNDVEIKRNLAAGSYGEQLKNRYEMATKGTLDRKLLHDMVEEMRVSAKAARDGVDAERNSREEGTVMGGRAKANPNAPPKAVFDAAKDGQYLHGPNGVTFQKKGGKLYDSQGNEVLVGAK
jgi:hypothetical protein